MTFVLSLGNPEFVLQLSDRRLTVTGGKVVEEEATKAISLECPNGRFALAYTGLARWHGFSTRDWMSDTLEKAAVSKFDILSIVEKFCEMATDEFNNHHLLKRLPQKSKCLSIMLTGWVDHHTPPRMGNLLITNFQDVESGVDSIEAWKEFKFYPFMIKESVDDFSFIQRVGAWGAMTQEDEIFLRDLMSQKLDSEAFLKRTLAWFRQFADRPRCGNTVGKQINSIMIFRDSSKGESNRFHTNVAQNEAFFPDKIKLSPFGNTSIKNLVVKPVEVLPDAPFFVPKVGRRRLCPCGKPKRYKNCCGRRMK